MVDSRPGERTADVLANAAGGGEQRLGAGAANESAKAVDPVGRSARSETAQPAPLGSFLRHLRLPRGTHHPNATPWESVNTKPSNSRQGDPKHSDLEAVQWLHPGVPLGGGEAEPQQEGQHGDAGLAGPAVDEIDDLVTCVVGNPDAGQGSPSSFF